MKSRTKRLILLGAALSLVGCAITGWTALQVIAWARDLPNRIVIDEDAIATTFGAAVTESYHQALRDGDSSLQTQILEEHFAPAIADNPDAAAWIGDEYRDDILALVDSDNPAVSSAASDVLSQLPPEPDTKP